MIKTDAPRFIPKDIHPTGEQLNIQLSKNKVVVIKANAGAAKTTTLALRIGEAIARKLEPENILALVFTPEARDVLKKRLLDIGIPPTTAARLKVATFEDFSIELLEKIECRKVAVLPQSKDLKEYVIAALENVSDNYTGKVDYLEIHTHNLAISQFIHTQLELKAKMLLQADVEGRDVEEVSAELGVPLSEYLTTIEYETLRLGHDDQVHFRGAFDATYDLARILDADPSARPLLPRYRLIICDELHDLNEASYRILQHLIDPQYSYFVGAGDTDQVIHSKLGASEEFMSSRFRASYPATVAYPLTYSYRHGPHLAYAMEAFKAKPVDSTLPLRTDISQLLYDDDAAASGTSCAEQVVKALERWKKSKHAMDGCAILIRDKHQSIAIENALMQADISYRTLEMKGYLQREEILFLRGMIAIALNNFATVQSKKIRGDIFDALAIFAEVSLSRDENMETFRQTVIDVPEALTWFFSARVDQRGAKDIRDKVSEVVDQLHAAKKSQVADFVLAELQQHLAGVLDFLHGLAPSNIESSLSQIVAEVEQQVTAMAQYLERSVMTVAPDALLQTLRNNLLALLLSLDNVVVRDVRHRMAKVVHYIGTLEADAQADVVLRQICSLMDIEALAKRLYVHAYDATVVTKSVAGFIAAAEKMQMNLRQFSEWIGAADAFISSRKGKHCVLLECVANAKGKEFDHVILPFLEKGEFPFAKADPKEEDNLFYVAATRAKLCLTLISPRDDHRRSAFIARMKINGTRARADAAVERNGQQISAVSRVEFKASGDDWAVAKALGAHWDFPRKTFYLKDGQDPLPFARWLRSRNF